MKNKHFWIIVLINLIVYFIGYGMGSFSFYLNNQKQMDKLSLERDQYKNCCEGKVKFSLDNSEKKE